MNRKIHITLNKEDLKVLISFGKKNKLEINIGEEAKEKNPDWNTDKINEFLINIASSIEEDDKLAIDINNDDLEENVVFKHIVSLFEIFVNEYNS